MTEVLMQRGCYP